MAEQPQRAWIAVCITIPDHMDGHQCADEIRKSIGFGQPVALLMGRYVPDPATAGTAEPKATWRGEDWTSLLREEILWPDAGKEHDISRESPAPESPGV
jgi:hypothetical protein